MGLWLLALELVSTWHFKPVATPPPHNGNANGNGAEDTNGVHDEPAAAPSMLDGFETPAAKKRTTEVHAGRFRSAESSQISPGRLRLALATVASR